MVAGHHEPPAADDLTGLSGRRLAIILPENPDVGTEHRLAYRGELPLEVFGLQDRDQAFGEAIELDELTVELAHEIALDRDGQR